jgi:hypothetical protein
MLVSPYKTRNWVGYGEIFDLQSLIFVFLLLLAFLDLMQWEKQKMNIGVNHISEVDQAPTIVSQKVDRLEIWVLAHTQCNTSFRITIKYIR